MTSAYLKRRLNLTLLPGLGIALSPQKKHGMLTSIFVRAVIILATKMLIKINRKSGAADIDKWVVLKYVCVFRVPDHKS